MIEDSRQFFEALPEGETKHRGLALLELVTAYRGEAMSVFAAANEAPKMDIPEKRASPGQGISRHELVAALILRDWNCELAAQDLGLRIDKFYSRMAIHHVSRDRKRFLALEGRLTPGSP